MFRQHEVWRALCAHPAHSHREMDGTSLLTDTPRGFQRLHGLPISPRGADECASIDPLNLPFEPAACTWNPDEVVSRGRCVHCCAKSRHEQLHGILEGNGGVVADADTHGDGDADNENTTAGAPNGLTVAAIKNMQRNFQSSHPLFYGLREPGPRIPKRKRSHEYGSKPVSPVLKRPRRLSNETEASETSMSGESSATATDAED